MIDFVNLKIDLGCLTGRLDFYTMWVLKLIAPLYLSLPVAIVFIVKKRHIFKENAAVGVHILEHAIYKNANLSTLESQR